MSKLNLEELIQQKLNQLEVPHKPEYWTQMEEELDTAAPIGVGGVGASLSKIYTISGIATSLVVISIIGYFSFKNNSTDIQDSNILTTLVNTESIAVNDVNTSDKNQIKQYQSAIDKSNVKESVEEPSNRILNKNIKTIKAVSTIKKPVNKSNAKDIPNEGKTIATIQNQLQHETSTIITADLIEIDDYDNLVNYNPRNLIKRNKRNDVKNANETSISNELLIIKPINKPTKNVFKKRKGILYRLSIRK